MQNKKVKRLFLGFSKDGVLQLFAFALILFFPYNYSISDQILFKAYNPIIFTAIGIILLFFTQKASFTKKKLRKVIAILAVLALMFFKNQYILQNFSLRFFVLQIMYIVCLLVILFRKIDNKALYWVLVFYSIEHMIGTAIPIFAPSFYEHSILPFLCRGKRHCFAIGSFFSGKNAGLTTHYSSNGINMAISALLFFSTFIKTKNKWSLVLLIVSVAFLLIIGKRAHLVFSIIIMLISYLLTKKQQGFSILSFIKKNIKLILVAMGSILTIGLLSSYIPQLNTTLDRLESTKNSSDALNGREDLYDLAIREWKQSPILGNGYGYFYYKSSEEFSFNKYYLENIHAHNDFLELLCDTGVIGALVYAVIILLVIKNSYKNNNFLRDPLGVYLFCFQYSLFYLLYCFSGTPLGLELTFSMLVIVIGVTNEARNEQELSKKCEN